MDYEAEGERPRARPKKTRHEDTERDRQTRQICEEDAMDRRKCRKLIKDVYNSQKDRV